MHLRWITQSVGKLGARKTRIHTKLRSVSLRQIPARNCTKTHHAGSRMQMYLQELFSWILKCQLHGEVVENTKPDKLPTAKFVCNFASGSKQATGKSENTLPNKLPTANFFLQFWGKTNCYFPQPQMWNNWTTVTSLISGWQHPTGNESHLPHKFLFCCLRFRRRHP